MHSNDLLAGELIAKFAKDLFALNGGASIPRRWKQTLARALAPPRKKVGRKRDLEALQELIAAVADSAALTPGISAKNRTDRTRQTIAASGRAKRAVAAARSTNVRAVERAKKVLDSYLQREPLTAEESSAAIQGFAQALQARLRAADAWELEARQRRARQARKG